MRRTKFDISLCPSRECGDVEEGQVSADKSVRMTESECHREGKILFEDGNCYNLLERGPCFQQSMWVVMALQVRIVDS